MNRVKMKTIIKNIGNLYSADSHGSFGDIVHLQNRALLIENGYIKTIFSEPDPGLKNTDAIIDAAGATVLPGFVDAHTHPVFWQTRETEFLMRIEGKSYEEIAAAGGGIRNSARNFQTATKAEIKAVTVGRLHTFLEYGTTTIEAKSGYGLTTESEIKALQILNELNEEQALEMVPTFLGAHEVPDAYRSNRKAYIHLLTEEMIPLVTQQDLAVFCDVFCEKGVFTIEETRLILNAAEKHGLKARIHADELNAFGAAELAAELGAVTADHLVKVSDEGIRRMAEKKVIPVLLPATTFFLGKDQYAPARKMLDFGCQVALATDFNPGSSMTQNMQLLWTIAALKMRMQPEELLWASTLIPARSLNLQSKIGTIEPGKQADLSIMDIPNLNYLAYHMGINHVNKTIKKGIVVFQR
jgi:imidazolonepropionase